MNYRIWLLALGTFAIGTEGYMIAGMLPQLSGDIGVSIPAAGQLVTAFSLAYALGSPVLATLSGHLDRRRLLWLSLLLFATGNFICGLASGYAGLMTGRIVAAAGAGMFAPAANFTAASLAPDHKRGQALSVVIGGLTIALLFGVPMGAWLASAYHWKMAFWIVGFVSLLAAGLIRLLFPSIPAAERVSLQRRLSALGNPAALSALAVTLAWGTGIFTVYTYVSDIFNRIGGNADIMAQMLLMTGIASCFGVGFGGFAADRFGSGRTILGSLLLLIIAVGSLSVVRSIPLAMTAMALWGFSGYVFNPAQQHRLIAFSGKDSAIVLSLHNSAIYLGSALGSILGGAVVAWRSAADLGAASAVAVMLSLLCLKISTRYEAGLQGSGSAK